MLLLAAVGVYLADSRLHLLEGLRGGLMSLLEPMQRAASFPRQFWQDTRDALRSREALDSENQQLEANNKLLQAQMQTFWSVEQENKRLRQALNAVAALEVDVMLAQVLRNATDTNNPTILINRGARDGVYVGQAALLGTGVLGQVQHVGANTAEILPLTNERHAIPVRVARSGLRGIVQGAGILDEVSVHHLPKQADVVVGDVLLTSGLGGGFPEGFPVASITRISPEQSGAFADIRARPMAELHDVRDVVLVWMREPHVTPPELSEPSAASTPESRSLPLLPPPPAPSVKPEKTPAQTPTHAQ
ncbi:MAG: rod shape-determining protein MreC [Gammaproteobacteria bacterium 28-57-27]|nr:MAG: rod shape-determining protein MreC [Gammaproteobacteria bacterium 28-57-27]